MLQFSSRLRKAVADPHMGLVVLARLLYQAISTPYHMLTFRRFSRSSFVHPLSSVRPRKSISIGSDVVISRNVTIWCESLVIGSSVQINPGTAIYGSVEIGNNVMIAPNCMIAGGNHGIERTDVPMIHQPSTCRGPIVIEDDCWIGANVVITDGVRIRTGSVIGAGSVVVKSTERYSINHGNPCRLSHLRNQR